MEDQKVLLVARIAVDSSNLARTPEDRPMYAESTRARPTIQG
jgi:hypothetical protein